MKGTKLAVVVGMTVAAVSLAAPAQADDYDAPFNNTIHRFGIYGPQDYNAWLAKISCERLSRGVDGDAYKSATFLPATQPAARNHPGPSVSVPGRRDRSLLP